jgi:hypothetical protein
LTREKVGFWGLPSQIVEKAKVDIESEKSQANSKGDENAFDFLYYI